MIKILSLIDNLIERVSTKRKWAKTIATLALALLAVSRVDAAAGGVTIDALKASPSASAINQYLERVAAEMQDTLPKRIDPITELVEVLVEGTTFTYGMKVDDGLSDADLQFIKRNAQSVGREYACQDDEIPALVNAGATVKWNFIHKGVTFVIVSISSCP